MAEIRNCKKCGSLFEYKGLTDLCINCVEKDEMDYIRVREYLREHPCAKIFEVVLALDISIEKIKRYLREERLEIIEKTNRFLGCEKCGNPIRSGKYCDSCAIEARHNFKTIYNPAASIAFGGNEDIDKSNQLKHREHKVNYHTYKGLAFIKSAAR